MNAKKPILLLSLAGFLFAGWLTYSKLVADACPLTEGCPYLLGLPVCVYGLVFFGIILAASLMDYSKKGMPHLNIVQWVSAIGVVFSGIFVLNEYLYPSCLIQPCTYTLLVPSCVYGLVMYAIIAYLAWKK